MTLGAVGQPVDRRAPTPRLWVVERVDGGYPEPTGPLERPCCCGRLIVARTLGPADVMAAVAEHQQSLLHRQWRAREDWTGNA